MEALAKNALDEMCPYSDFSGPYFLAFRLNTGRYRVSLRIQSKCGKIRTRKTPNADTFHAMMGNRKRGLVIIFANEIIEGDGGGGGWGWGKGRRKTSTQVQGKN